MRKSLTLFFVSVATFCKAQIINPGDNLASEFESIGPKYYFKAPAYTDWAEGANMLLIGDRPDSADCEVLFLALRDTTLIGILQPKIAERFLFDLKGDSILSVPSDYFVLPAWTVRRAKRTRPSDKSALFILNALYESTMQSNDGQPDEKTLKKYEEFKTDTTLANRQIILLLDSYLSIISQAAAKGLNPPADVSLRLMRMLFDECLSVYEMAPAIVLVYMGEALQSAGKTDMAREHFKAALEIYPHSIPLRVYNCQLEEDPYKKEMSRKYLKRKYPDHWMVKEL